MQQQRRRRQNTKTSHSKLSNRHMTLREVMYPPHTGPHSPNPRRPHRLFHHICAHRYPWEADGEREKETPRAVVLALTCASPPWWSSSLWLHLIRTLALHSRALLHGHACGGWGVGEADQRSRFLSVSLVRRGGVRGTRAFLPGPKRRRLAHLLASPALPGHSSQPLSNRRAGERAFGGRGREGERGEEVLKGLERTWNGERGTSSPRASLQPLDMLQLKPASTSRILPRACV